MKIKAKNIFMPTLVLFTICALMTAALGATNLLTKEQIKKMELEKQTQAVQKVLPADSYKQKTITLDGADYQSFTATKNGTVVGYAFAVSAAGYGGDIAAIVGIKSDGTIHAVEITDISNETPGLGQNAARKDFTEQYSGKNGVLSVVKNGAGESEIDAITGATITSSAVTSAVNKAIQLYQTVKGE